MEISEFSTEKIEDIRVPWVICGICKRHRSGILHIMGSNRKLGRRLFFADGALQFATSNLEQDRLGQILLSAGRISSDQFKAAMFSAAQGKRFGKILVDSGSINQKEINYFVGMQIRNILFSTFELQDGLYFFEEKPISLPKDLQLKVLVGHLILNGLRSMKNLMLVHDEINQFDEKKLVQGESPLFPIHELPLTQNEAFLYSRLDGMTTLSDLIKITGLPREMVYKFLYAGFCLEFIGVKEGSKTLSLNRFDHAFKEQASAEKPRADLESLSSDEKAVRQKVLAKFSEISVNDFWSFMGLKQGSLEEDVRRRYLELSQEFHPDLFHESYLQDLMPYLNQVISYLNLAYHTLNDPKALEDYEQNRKKEKEQADLSLKEKQKTGESLYRKGMHYYLDEDFFNAHRHFELALKYFPKKASYWCAKGMTEMQNPQWRDRARKSLEKATSLDKYYDEPFVHLAKIAMAEGETEQALTQIQKALEINPMNETAMNMEEEIGNLEQGGFLSKFRAKNK